MLGTLVGLQSSSELASQLSASLDQFESRYASILAREIIDSGESQGMSLHVKTCGTPSRLLRAFHASSQQGLDVNPALFVSLPIRRSDVDANTTVELTRSIVYKGEKNSHRRRRCDLCIQCHVSAENAAG